MSWWQITLIVFFVAYLPIWLLLGIIFVRQIPFIFIKLPIWAWVILPRFLYRRGIQLQMEESVSDFAEQMRRAGIDIDGKGED